MKKRIAVDMDGVLADVYSQFIDYHERDFGIRLDRSDLEGLSESEAFPNCGIHVNTRGFFRTVPLVPDSDRVLQAVNSMHDVYIVSAALEFPNSLDDKYQWLREHFPFIGWRQIVFCGTKEIVDADIMIDDHLKNLDKFKGETLLFTQPHNRRVVTRHRRVETWREIEKILS